MIASEFGVTSAPQPVAPPAETAVAADEQQRQSSPAPGSAEDSPNFFDESFDFEEPFDILESSDSPAAAPQPDKPKEKRPRKRRRRRRPGRETSATVEEAGVAEVKEIAEVSVEPAPETDEHRPKRRRGRRGKKKRSSDESAPAAIDAPAVEETSSELADQGGAEAAEDKEAGKDEQLDSVRTTRGGLRGIPTWEEAVGLIVAKNLEARSKRSGGGSHHGRGKRGGKQRS